MLTENISTSIAAELHIKPKQSEAAIRLLDENNTVPFIARYRKEATGELDEDQLRNLEERLGYLRSLVKRQEEILAKIAEQDKLTPELQQAIEKAAKLQELEDLYLPYKQKKRTRAQMAREKGLDTLAAALLAQAASDQPALEYAASFIDPAKGVENAEDALQGAMDIAAETIMEDASLRKYMRQHLWKTAELSTELDETSEESQTFLMYADYHEPIRTLPSHRVLAMNRGEKKGCLKIRLLTDHEANIQQIYQRISRGPSPFAAALQLAVEDGYKRLLLPSLERELRSQLTENAEKQAIHIFGVNLRQLLLQAGFTAVTSRQDLAGVDRCSGGQWRRL